MPTNNGNNKAWTLLDSAFSLSGRLQGMVINVVINVIDRAQTEHAIRETKKILAERELKDRSGPGN